MKRLIAASPIHVLALLALAACSRTDVFETPPGTGTLVVTPSSARVATGKSLQFDATLLVEGSAPRAASVEWQVLDPAFGAAIDASGLFTAPGQLPQDIAAPDVRVRATLKGRADTFAEAVVSLAGEQSGPAARLERVTDGPVSAIAGEPLPEPLRVKAVDDEGRGVEGVVVTFGSPFDERAVTTITDAGGIAEGAPRVDTKAGTQTIPVTSPGLNTLTFTVDVKAGPVAMLDVTHPTGRGSVGASLADPAVVTATDAYGNPVPQAALAGTGPGSALAEPLATVTDPDGRLAFALTLDRTAGPQEFAFESSTGVRATLTITALGGAPARIELVSGDLQTGIVDTILAAPVSVRVVDADGLPCFDVAIEWSADGAEFVESAPRTDADGLATSNVRLGRRSGVAQLTVRAPPAAPDLSLSARVLPGAASRLQLVSGADQSTTAGLAFGAAFGVRTTDAFSNGVAGVTVRYGVVRGGGRIEPAEALTGADGLAQALMTAGAAGGQTFRASADGLFGSPLDLTLTAIAPTRDVLSSVSGGGQTGSVLEELSLPLVVRVTNAGQPAAGRVVSFGVALGDGSVRPTSAITAADGTARTTARLGAQAGAHRFSASVAGASNSPVFFDATAEGRVVAFLRVVSGAGQTGAPGAPLAQPFVVEALDAAGTVVDGVVIAAVANDGGTITPSATTNAQGRASFDASLGAADGEQRLTLSTGSITLEVRATASSQPGVRRIRVSGGSGQSNEVGLALAVPLEVIVTDANGTPLAGVTVRWRAEAERAFVSPVESVTAADGKARTTATLGKPVGTQRFSAELEGVTNPAIFTATGTAAPAERVIVADGDGQSALVAQPLARPLVARVVDRVGNPIANVGVTFRAGLQGGTVSPATEQRSNAQGEAQATVTLGTQVGACTFFAAGTGLTTEPAVFTATATNQVERISLSPQASVVEQGASVRYVATAIYADGTSGVVTVSATWSTTDAAIASVSDAAGAKGVATALAAGRVTIRATHQGKTGETSLTVNPATLRQIVVFPVDPTIVRGSTRPFRAVGTWTNGNVSELTETATWTSSRAAVATVSDAAGSKGLVRGVAPGTATITATKDGISGARDVEVSQAPVRALEITPANVVQPAGGGQTFRATATYTDGTVEDVTQVAAWSSSDTALMTVQNAPATPGRATFLAAGTPDVVATHAGITARVKVTITAATVTTLTMFPDELDLSVRDFVQVRVLAVYSDGTVSDAAQLATWTSANPAVADVSNAAGQRGLVTGVATGRTTVTASLGGRTATLSVTVDAATPARMRIMTNRNECPKGGLVFLRAFSVYTNGSRVDITDQVSWSSANPAIAVVNQGSALGGIVQCLAPGRVRITATYQGVDENETVTVTNATLSSIELAPTNVGMAKGDSREFLARGVYSDGSRQDLTALATWTSSDTSVLSVSNAPGSRGRTLALAPGSATLTVAYDGVSASTPVTVSNANLLVLVVSPANPVASRREQFVQFSAIAVYDDNTQTDISSQVAWSSDNPQVAIISNDAEFPGVLIINGTGTCRVTASYAGKSTTTTLTVR